MRRAMLVLAILALGAMALAQGSSSSGNQPSSNGSSGNPSSNSSSSKQQSLLTKAVTLPDDVFVHFALVNGAWKEVLTNQKGMTLYYNDQGKKNKAACTGSCTGTWKPLILPNGSPAPTGVSWITHFLSTLTGPNGGKQIEADGHPLYTFSKDQRQGQARGAGDLASKHWHVATPDLFQIR